jgi:hypothetical protein
MALGRLFFVVLSNVWAQRRAAGHPITTRTRERGTTQSSDSPVFRRVRQPVIQSQPERVSEGPRSRRIYQTSDLRVAVRIQANPAT